MMSFSTLDLSNNNITYLSHQTFDNSNVEKMLDINLNNNNIDCCSSEKAINLLFQKNINVDCILDNENITAATPTLLNEKCVGGRYSRSKNENNNIGLIVGVVIGILVVIAIVSCCVGYYTYKRKKEDLLQGISAMEFLDCAQKQKETGDIGDTEYFNTTNDAIKNTNDSYEHVGAVYEEANNISSDTMASEAYGNIGNQCESSDVYDSMENGNLVTSNYNVKTSSYIADEYNNVNTSSDIVNEYYEERGFKSTSNFNNVEYDTADNSSSNIEYEAPDNNSACANNF
eukprot:Pgem_evm1s17821